MACCTKNSSTCCRAANARNEPRAPYAASFADQRAELFGEHISKAGECGLECFAFHGTQALHEPLFIESAHLIKQDKAALFPETDGNTKRRRATACRHRRYHHGPQIIVHFRRRDDNTRTSFLNLTANRRVQRYKLHFATYDGSGWSGRPYHFNSMSPAFPNSGQTVESSPAWARRLAASAHPARGFRLSGASTIRFRSSDKSRSSPAPSPSCARIGLGMITPDELPSFRTRARITLLLLWQKQ
jgi:hypothetical protein